MKYVKLSNRVKNEEVCAISGLLYILVAITTHNTFLRVSYVIVTMLSFLSHLSNNRELGILDKVWAHITAISTFIIIYLKMKSVGGKVSAIGGIITVREVYKWMERRREAWKHVIFHVYSISIVIIYDMWSEGGWGGLDTPR